MDAATVKVSACPAEMLLELAVMETVGREAAALVANAEIAKNVVRDAKDGKNFMGMTCLVMGITCLVLIDLG